MLMFIVIPKNNIVDDFLRLNTAAHIGPKSVTVANIAPKNPVPIKEAIISLCG